MFGPIVSPSPKEWRSVQDELLLSRKSLLPRLSCTVVAASMSVTSEFNSANPFVQFFALFLNFSVFELLWQPAIASFWTFTL